MIGVAPRALQALPFVEQDLATRFAGLAGSSPRFRDWHPDYRNQREVGPLLLKMVRPPPRG
jgi:hypothetical protein